MRRIIFALLVTPLVLPLSVLFLTDEAATFGAIMIGYFTIGATLLIGIPLIVLCVRWQWIQIRYAIVGGALAGLMCALTFWNGHVASFLNILWKFALIGAVHGLFFWVLAFWKNNYFIKSN